MDDQIIIYHGSEKIVEKPVLGGGSLKNDYGYGFYCTEDRNAACIWANRNGTFGYCNRYEIKQKGLKVLDLTSDDFDAMHWISLLLQHRSLDEADQRKFKTLLTDLFSAYPVSLEDIDIVVGYRADDRYFRYCKDFLSSQLDYDSLVKSLKLGRLGKQYVLVSERAFENLRFLDAERIDDGYLHSYANLIEKAGDDYQRVLEGVDQRNGVFIRELLYGRR